MDIKIISAECNGIKLKGNNLTSIKRQASRICNQSYNVMDEFTVVTDINNGNGGGEFTYHRFNKKYPNGEIKRGTWK